MTSKADASTSIRLLLIDDEARSSWGGVLDSALRPLGFTVLLETDADKWRQAVSSQQPDVLLLDLHFPGDDELAGSEVLTTGGRLLATLRTDLPALPVVLFSSRFADADIALERFAAAPHAVFSKHQIGPGVGSKAAPWAQTLATTLRGAIELAARENAPDPELPAEFVVGGSAAMRRVAAAIHRAARNDEPILLQGESGSGKATVARTIHDLSARAGSGRFVHLDCSGLNDATLAAELFGQEGSAGRIEQVHRGTLFVDEFQVLPNAVQDRLREVLETRKVRRIGETHDRNADIRLLIASSHAISDLVEDGVINVDFAYQVGGFPLPLPSLRERLDDLPVLFRHFVGQINASRNRNVTDVLRPEVLEKLRNHPWRGNLRELRAALDRAIVAKQGNLLLPDDIRLLAPPSHRTRQSEPDRSPDASPTIAPPAPPQQLSPAERIRHFADALRSAAISERWGMLAKDGKPPKEVRKGALEDIARWLWQTEGSDRHKIGQMVLCFLIDTDNLVPPDTWYKAYARVRTMMKAHGIQLTRLVHANDLRGEEYERAC